MSRGWANYKMRENNNSEFRHEQFVLQQYFRIYAPRINTELEYKVIDYSKGITYKIDLADLTNKIAWELDGGYHRRLRDETKDEFLMSKGWTVIRVKQDSWHWGWLWED